MTAWEILAQIKGTLALVDGIATCAIGLEANITPSDYPLIRIVPTRLIPKDEVGNRALIELTLYFGDALLESADGLEAVYRGCWRWNPRSDRRCCSARSGRPGWMATA